MGEGDLNGVIGDEREAADAERDEPGIVIVGQIDADEEKADQKIVHEPVRPTAHIRMEKGCLRLQVIGGRKGREARMVGYRHAFDHWMEMPAE